MLQKSNFLILMFCVFSTTIRTLPMEPVCSKFDYEYKTLEAMLRVERYVEDTKKEIEKIQDDVTKKLREIEEFKQNQERDFTAMKGTIEEQAVVKSEPVDYGKLGMDSETSCTKTHYYKAGDVFTASANGMVHGGNCSLTFIQSGMKGYDTVEPCLSLCVKIVSYTMDSCNVEMAYHDGIDDYTPVTFDCHTFPPVMWCSSKNDLKVVVSEAKNYRGKDYAITLEVKPFCGPLDVNEENDAVPAIAFSAGNPTRKTGYRGVLLFSIVTTNVGGAYDKMTGLFTCPMDGVYMFVLTIATSNQNSEAYCRIQLNHTNVVISRAYYNQFSTFSNTVFLQLTKNDVVGPGDCYSINDLYTSHSASSFSGALIAKT